jgi:hypothetical protein
MTVVVINGDSQGFTLLEDCPGIAKLEDVLASGVWSHWKYRREKKTCPKKNRAVMINRPGCG